MPELNWNLAQWSAVYNWKSGGEEWSEAWGGSEAQWFCSLYSRLHRFLPARSILEIAPGFGRWTKFLLAGCERYVGIDLTADCVQACERIFATARNARFFQNDGLSLSAASDGQFDFVFTFDSLVHAEMDVMDSYVPQILRKLTPGGAAFVHHSNLFALGPNAENKHHRARSVSGESVIGTVARAGGRILVQEQINWGDQDLTDCLTLFVREEHPDTAPPIHTENPRFMAEASMIRASQSPYTRVNNTRSPRA